MRNPTAVLASALAALLLAAGPATAAPGGGEDPPPDPEDLNPPRIEITASAASPWAGWYAGSVDLSIETFDDVGPHRSGMDFAEYVMRGATTAQGPVDVLAGTTVSVTASGLTEVHVSAFDRDGNLGTRSYNVGIDRTAPTVAYGGRLATGDRVFFQGEKVPLDYTCSDVGTQVASCVGPSPSGSDLATGTLGEHVVNVEATDRVGNTSRVPVRYTVAPQEFTVVTPATISGTARPGGTLTATHAEFSPAPTTLSYRWYRDGAYTGVSDQIYSVTDQDVGSLIRVRSFADRAGWPSGNSESLAVVVGARRLEVAGQLEVTGTPRVGSILTAVPPVVREPLPARASGDPATLSYRWRRDGVVVPGATGASYRLVPGDVGRLIGVDVVATAPGHETVVLTGRATGRVAKAVPVLRAKARALGQGRVRLTVTAVVAGLRPTGKVVVRRGDSVVLRKAVGARPLVAVASRQPRGRQVYTVVYGGARGIAARTVKVTTRVR